MTCIKNDLYKNWPYKKWPYKKWLYKNWPYKKWPYKKYNWSLWEPCAITWNVVQLEQYNTYLELYNSVWILTIYSQGIVSRALHSFLLAEGTVKLAQQSWSSTLRGLMHSNWQTSEPASWNLRQFHNLTFQLSGRLFLIPNK